MSDTPGQARLTRRGLLAGAGAVGAGLAAASDGLLAGQAAAAPVAAGARSRPMLPPGAPSSSAFFGRMFPRLAPFAEPSDTVRAALLEVGAPGGIMDARDDLAAGPKALIVDPAVNGNPTPANPYGTNPDNPAMTAGSTFVGQFTDHDITFDQTSHLGVHDAALRAGLQQGRLDRVGHRRERRQLREDPAEHHAAGRRSRRQ